MTHYKTVPQKAKLNDPAHPGRLGRGPLDPHGGIALPWIHREIESLWTYAHTAYRFAFQYNVSNSFRNIPNCSRGHGGCSAASLGMLSQSRRQRQRLQRCRIYPQVGDKSHWNSRERVVEPEELSFLQATDSDTEMRGAKRAAEGASPLTYAWANTSLTLAPQCFAFT